jgi:hypothetical protein
MLLRRAEPHHVFHAGTEKYIVDKSQGTRPEALSERVGVVPDRGEVSSRTFRSCPRLCPLSVHRLVGFFRHAQKAEGDVKLPSFTLGFLASHQARLIVLKLSSRDRALTVEDHEDKDVLHLLT